MNGQVRFVSHLIKIFPISDGQAREIGCSSAVTSVTFGLSTLVSRTSAWNCIKKLLATAPPSTRKLFNVMLSLPAASKTSRLISNLSSVALMIWFALYLELGPRLFLWPKHPNMGPQSGECRHNINTI